MLTRRLITILLALAVLCGYLYFGEDLRQWLLPGGILLGMAILTYVMQHQINWLWYRRNPPRVPESIDRLYRSVSPYYSDLPEEARRTFGSRATLFVMSKEFIGQGVEKVPEDLKYMVAFYSTLITMHQKHFLFKGYDRIVYYLHPFLSPNFPDDVHTCEVEDEDGTLIFSIEQLTASFISPKKYYETGLHAMSQAYARKYLTTEIAYPDDIWQTLRNISGRSKAEIEQFVGLPQDDPWPVVVHHWLNHREAFEKHAPELHAKLRSEFGLSAL